VNLLFGINFAVNQQVRPVFKKSILVSRNQWSQCPAKDGEWFENWRAHLGPFFVSAS